MIIPQPIGSQKEPARKIKRIKKYSLSLFFKPKMIAACKSFLKCGALRGALRLAKPTTAVESQQK